MLYRKRRALPALRAPSEGNRATRRAWNRPKGKAPLDDRESWLPLTDSFDAPESVLRDTQFVLHLAEVLFHFLESRFNVISQVTDASLFLLLLVRPRHVVPGIAIFTVGVELLPFSEVCVKLFYHVREGEHPRAALDQDSFRRHRPNLSRTTASRHPSPKAIPPMLVQ